ncbi:MAG: MATE family efflux transporter [Treponema sp.]|jgi:putative MATE family efflux protein|nr:MATE family efflux transporter [Treponema sp.]
MKGFDFTKGGYFFPLLKFTVPILLALFLQAMYGAVDLMVVGHFGDTSSVSAVAIGSQVMQTITGIITGLTMGTTIMIGQIIGAKHARQAERTVGASICLFAVVAAAITIIMTVCVRPIVKLMHTPEAAFDKSIQYILICSAGTVFIVAYNLISGIFRGIGNSKLPLCFVAIACFVNIIGDIILVGIFNLDAAGAAIATIFAQAVSVVLSLVIIRAKGLPFFFSIKSIRFHSMEIANILRFGAPLALQDSLTNLSFLIITSIVNSLGLVASAAIGINEKIVVFIMLIPMAYMSSVSTFTAQNIGAHKPERARKGMYYAISSSLVFGLICFILSFWHGRILAGIFSSDIEVVAACAEYMKAYSIDCLLVCFLFCFMGYFNGCGNTVFVLVQGILSAFLVRIPFSYFVSKIPGVSMLQIGFAAPISTVFSIILCVIIFGIKKRAAVSHAPAAIPETVYEE